MSKSVNQMNTLYLADDDEMIRAKIKKARTDEGPKTLDSEMPGYIEGLFTLLKVVSAPEVLDKYLEDFKQARIRYGDMKKQLAEDMVRFIGPIREKTAEILANEKMMKDIFEQGATRARESAKATLQLVREAMGLRYY